MRHIRDQMDTDPEAAQAMDNYIDSFKDFHDAFEMMPRNTTTAKHTMEEFDKLASHVVKAYTLKYGYNPVTCKKGCSACCHINVNVSPREADLMVSFVRSQNIRLEKNKVLAQADKMPDEFHRLDWETKACPFLSDAGECKVYRFRPLSCRKYLVASDPKICDTRTSMGDPLTVVDPIMEAFVAAFLTVDGAQTDSRKNMASMLLERIAPNDPLWF